MPGAAKATSSPYAGWLHCEPENLSTARLLTFALEQAEEAAQWARETVTQDAAAVLDEEGAGLLRRKYLRGRLELHSIPGYIFEQAMLDAVRRRERGDTAPVQTLWLPLRDGWQESNPERVRRLLDRAEAKQEGFRFGNDRTWVDRRRVTPEGAEYELFQERVLRWQWGAVRILSEKRLGELRQPGFLGKVHKIELHKSRESDPTALFKGWKIRFHLERVERVE